MDHPVNECLFRKKGNWFNFVELTFYPTHPVHPENNCQDGQDGQDMKDLFDLPY